MEIQVRSVSRSVLHLLADSRPTAGPRLAHHALRTTHFSLLSLHDRALNLRTPSGDLLGLVHPVLGNGPFHIVLAEPVDFSAVAHAFHRGCLSLDLSLACLWEPQIALPQHGAEPADFPDCTDFLATAIEQHLTPSPCHPITPSPCHPITPSPCHPITPSPCHLVTLSSYHPLPHALHTGNSPAIMASSSALAGLGPGLTPAGDDFLVGLMAGLWLLPRALHPSLTVAAACRLIANAAVPRTTTLSGAWLRHAARSEFGEPWHDLWEALHRRPLLPIGGGERFDAALDRILATGATSGADALTGFLAWIRMERETRRMTQI